MEQVCPKIKTRKKNLHEGFFQYPLKKNSKMRYFILLFILCVSLNGLWAQEYSFTLKEAQDYALQNNKTLMNASQDVSLAHQKVLETTGNGLPQISGTVDYMTNFNYQFQFSMGSSSETPTINTSVLDEGDLELLNFLNQSFGSSGSVITMEDQASANIQVSQLIFSGQYWVGIQMAKLGKKIAEQNLTTSELDVKVNVANTYYLIIATEELLRIYDGIGKNLEEVLKHTSNMYAMGVAEQTDVDQIRISLSQIDNSKNNLDRNLKVSYTMFRILTGINHNAEIVLNDNIKSIIDNIDAGIVLNDSAFGVDQNITYQMMRTQEELGQKSVEMKKWSYAPTLAGYYSYTEKLLTSSFDLTPKNAAGLTLNVPIFSGGIKRSQLSQAKIELDKTTRSKELVEEQLAMQDNQLSYELNSAYENYETQKENVDVAERVFNNINNKYKQGMVSSLDLTQANSNYLQAESNYISSVLSVLQAKLQLDKLYNNL